jgi:adenylyl cyclase-associated protein
MMSGSFGILIESRDPKQVQWIQSYYQIFKDLSEYVKNTFPHGLTWNPNGVSPKEAMKTVSSRESSPSQAPAPSPSSSQASSATAGGPPPPPPPPPGPAPKFDIKEAAKPVAAVGGIGAVFSELNKGDSVTKGLKKVSANEMTHKNPSLRASSIVPDRSESSLSPTSSISRNKSPAPRKTPKPESLRTKKPPKKELDGNKWIIENFDNEAEMIEIEASISQSILISRCSKTTIKINGKANAISIDNTARLSLVIDSLVSSVDVVKSSNFALQVLGTLPTILLDQVDGAQMYLGKESMKTEVFSSKSSSVNLNIIEGEEGDFKEVALPEQIRTYINEKGQLISEIVEHAG